MVSSQRPGPFHGDTKTYFNVIDDHIITVKLADATDRRLEEVYRTTHSIEQFFANDLIDVFRQHGQSTLFLEYSPKKAAKMRKVFSEYFGREY